MKRLHFNSHYRHQQQYINSNITIFLFHRILFQFYSKLHYRTRLPILLIIPTINHPININKCSNAYRQYLLNMKVILRPTFSRNRICNRHHHHHYHQRQPTAAAAINYSQAIFKITQQSITTSHNHQHQYSNMTQEIRLIFNVFQSFQPSSPLRKSKGSVSNILAGQQFTYVVINQ